jgi:hypothetical protein
MYVYSQFIMYGRWTARWCMCVRKGQDLNNSIKILPTKWVDQWHDEEGTALGSIADERL